jgi:hypothetical protein
VLDTDSFGRTLFDCRPDSYLNATSTLCVACPGGQISPAGASNVSECYCPAGVFTNCGLNELLLEHAPYSVHVGEAWGAGMLPDLSGNGRDATVTVAPSPGRQREGWVVRRQVLAISSPSRLLNKVLSRVCVGPSN